MFIVRDLDWKFVASNFKGYFNSNFFDWDQQNCSKNTILTINMINNSGNFSDCHMSSKNPVVSKIRLSNRANWTVVWVCLR